MGSYNLKNFRKFGDLLEPDETFIAGLFGMPPGGVKRNLAGGAGLFGAVYLLRNQEGATAIELPAQFVLGLTPRRIVFFDAKGLGGRPKVPLFSVPLEAVTSVVHGGSGLMANRVVLGLRDAPELEIEIQKGMPGPWARQFVERLSSMIAAPPSRPADQ